MTLQDISDRLEIQDLLVRYCYALDRSDWPAFDNLFTADAVLDYTAFGGPRAGVREMAAFLRAALESMLGAQHTISTTLIELDGDRATASSAGLVPMRLGGDSGNPDILLNGLWYHDVLVRTAAGWRIAQRIQEKSWARLLPGQS